MAPASRLGRANGAPGEGQPAGRTGAAAGQPAPGRRAHPPALAAGIRTRSRIACCAPACRPGCGDACRCCTRPTMNCWPPATRCCRTAGSRPSTRAD
jgi:hypothetical protein